MILPGTVIKSILVSPEYGLKQFTNKVVDGKLYRCEYEAENLGDYGIPWAIEYINGEEVRRWNLRNVQMVELEKK